MPIRNTTEGNLDKRIPEEKLIRKKPHVEKTTQQLLVGA